MYYYNSKPTELEKLLVEFLEFNKAGKAESQGAQNTSERGDSILADIGKGWPYYKGYAASLQEQTEQDSPDLLGFTPIESQEQPVIENAEPLPFPDPIGYSAPERHAQKEYEMDYAHHLMSDISARLMPHVIEVLNEQEFTGSPIFEGYVYRERLHQLVESTLSRAAAANQDVAEIQNSTCQCSSWQRRQLLRAVVEALLIGELFFRRRPIYRKLIDSGWNPGTIV